MKLLIVLFSLISVSLMAQDHVAHFSFWKPKPGQAKNFETGYKQHLQWHKNNGDKWNWYGWYIISGSKDDIFVDATFDHNWSDFDNPVNPAGDGADNALHTYPFGDFESSCKMIFLPGLSIRDSSSLQQKLLRLIRIDVSDIETGKKLVEKLKAKYQSGSASHFMTFKMVDGGNLNQLILLIGMKRFEDFGESANLQEDLSAIETSLKIKTIISLTSETLLYRPDMSLLFF